jgi:hypothetical protein
MQANEMPYFNASMYDVEIWNVKERHLSSWHYGENGEQNRRSAAGT